MAKQRSGIQNHFLCEQPLIRGFKEACVWTKHVVYCQETQEYTKTVVRYCLETLQMWFDAIGFVDEVQSCRLHCKIVLINVEPVSNLSLSLCHSLPSTSWPFIYLSIDTMPCSSARWAWHSLTLRTCSSGVPESISVFEPIGWVNSSTSQSKTVTCHSYL